MVHDKIENVLQDTVQVLTRAIDTLKANKDEVVQRLHDPDNLPESCLNELSIRANDLAHELRLLLEPRPVLIANYFLGSANCKCLNAAVELAVADILGRDSMTLADLAKACGANEIRLKQIMRVLHNDGIFEFHAASSSYSNNACSLLLQKKHWTKWWYWVDLYGNEFYEMARGIPAACRQGEKRMPSQIAFDTDMSMFSWFAAQGSLHRVHRTLGGGAIAQAPGILQDYPWEEVIDGKTTIIDIGGGGGGLVATLCRAFPDLHGGIFDRPEVIQHAVENFHSPQGIYQDIGHRVARTDLRGGDFFQGVPRYEIYTMKWCLHDWGDEEAVQVLSNIRKAIIPGPRSRLILFEILLREGRSGHLARMADLSVFMAANGRERDKAEWCSLALKSGWSIRKVYNLRRAWPSAMELVPV
ncbi:O-methyltransferase-domain-containing protein [Aspergillus pseudotamarii]|uniref:O-methyltransferase-domain-containing protein n=1 Tax=Aspergillus pseudotamarii TaxID=132259 RepID=A0A5N6SU87_ASPPS|nr:O-methyltransferase-domain-containing protein [Aspergillus pseudotamarii]KAE8137351.1 O-methyltransferase-domain-containing protein [Aspergillus pseudotamarii]